MLKIPRVYSDLHSYCSFCSGLLGISANDQAQADWCQHVGAKQGFLQVFLQGYLPRLCWALTTSGWAGTLEGPLGF